MKKLLKSTLILVVAAVILFSGVFATLYILSNTVTLDTSLLPQALAEPVFFDSNGNKMNYSGSSALSADDIPQNLKNAFIALEDKRFYSHKGYDIKRIGGAAVKNVKAGALVEGASTITQQLIKNTHLSSEKTFKRKINEILLAVKLERQYTKDEIMAMYLSVIYFGGGIYGVKDAAKYYFDRDIDELSVAQCASLAGIVKNPVAYSPKDNLEKSTVRRNLVLKLMREQNMISLNIYEKSVAEKTVVSLKREELSVEQSYIKQCINEILSSLNITRFQLENSGLKIHTYYNPEAQKLLSSQLKNKSNYAEDNLEGAGALIDNESRGIIAYYSTIPYPFRRQAGSVIKPLVAYAPALEKGVINIASPINDEKINIGGYSPANFNDVYYGWTTPREAIKKSMNSVAVKTLSYIGSDYGLNYGRKFGLKLSDADNSLALALGGLTDGVTVLEMAGAYCTLANSGEYKAPTFIKYAADKSGKVCFSNEELPYRILSAENSAILTDVLVDTAKSGTARTLSSLPFQVASKTGTVGSPKGSDDKPNSDAWNLSYTTAHTLAMWHGGTLTSETGGGNATMSAKEIWSGLYTNGVSALGSAATINGFYYPRDFELPETVVSAEIDAYALLNEQRVLLAGENTPSEFIKTELFPIDKVPTDVSEIFSHPTVEGLNVEVVGLKSDETSDETAENNEENTMDEDDEDKTNIGEENGNGYDYLIPEIRCKVKIEFLAKDAFSYRIERTVNGQTTLIAVIDSLSGQAEFTDAPYIFDEFATYSVTPFFESESGTVFGETASETVWIPYEI